MASKDLHHLDYLLSFLSSLICLSVLPVRCQSVQNKDSHTESVDGQSADP